MKYKKFIRITHRDVGYVSVALILIYAVSGIAVNHINDWNPNYKIEETNEKFTPNPDSTLSREESLEYVVNELNITDSINTSFKPAPGRLQIFIEGKTINANLIEGTAQIETVKSRTGFREVNFLHLNVPKKVWTYVADLFALALIYLAITGMFMITNHNGLKGRGKWFVAIGLLIPLIFWLIYYI